MPNYEGPDDKIEVLARYALETGHENFRKAAEQIDSFKDVIEKEFKVGYLTDAELQFCEGWLYLARLQFPENELDQQIVRAVQSGLDNASQTRAG